MNLNKSHLLYEGKGKRVLAIEGEKNLVWMEFKDSLTAFNAQKRGEFQNKGSINREVASIIFRYLKRANIESHWVQDVGEAGMICEKLEMIPLEVVVRNVVAGSLAKKFGLPEGEKLSQPLVEFYYKKDELNDPFISDDQVLFLKVVEHPSDLESLKKSAHEINDRLTALFDQVGIQLVDFKLEFGRSPKGDLRLGDEITPDSCRLWDKETGQKLDKDRFRRDLGGVAEGYQEVLDRLRRWLGARNGEGNGSGESL